VVFALCSAALPAAGAATVPSAGNAAAVPAAGAAARSGHGADSATTWAVQPTPNPLVRQGSLTAVSCTSATFCIAAGNRLNPVGQTVPLAEAWNGTTWSVQQAASPAGVRGSRLTGVSCSSVTFCMAVGSSDVPGESEPLAEVWHGSGGWSLLQMPTPSGQGLLTGVSCTSPSACVAVGSYLGAGDLRLALAEEWNGTAWAIHNAAPGPTTSELSGVSCTSASACIAVGDYQFRTGSIRPLSEAWNGTAWSIKQPLPSTAPLPRAGTAPHGRRSRLPARLAPPCTCLAACRAPRPAGAPP
jgi:hypothetical protein